MKIVKRMFLAFLTALGFAAAAAVPALAGIQVNHSEPLT